MIRNAVVAGVATLLPLAGVAAAQSEAPSYQTASAPLTTTAPGSPSGFLLWIDYRNPSDPSGKPHSVQRVVLRLHPGTKIDTGVPEQCKASDQEFAQRGASACPPESQVGAGEIEFDNGSPSGSRFTKTRLTLFNNKDELILYNETTNTPGPPLRVAARGKIEDATITTEVPPLPGTPPPDPFLAVKTVRETVDAVTRGSGASRRSYITTPPGCPPSGHWTNTLTFTYRNGVTQTVPTISPCAESASGRRKARRRSTRLRLAIRPRSARAGRLTRFRFRVTALVRGKRRAVRRATIKFAGRRLRTNRRGRATMVRRLVKPGRYGVVASRKRLGRARATVKVR
jgi:hypothetical protein